MPSILQILVQELMRAEGIEHRARYLSLKRYLTELTDEQFEEQVMLIDDPFVYNYLLYLGLSMPRIMALVKAWEERKK